MKKLLFALVFAVGCSAPSDEIQYSRSDTEIKLKITHRNNGNSCSIELTNMEQAEKYKLRLQKLINDIDEFEKELVIREKN